jgi:hypothetical protein
MVVSLLGGATSHLSEHFERMDFKSYSLFAGAKKRRR